MAARAALGVRLAAYRFDKYRTKEPAEKKPSLTLAQIATDGADAAQPNGGAAFHDNAIWIRKN